MNDGKSSADSRITDWLGGLPQEVTPPEDLWPAIETTIARQSADTEALVAQLPQDVPPRDDLWSAIASELTRDAAAGSATRAAWWHTWPSLAACCAFVAIVGFTLLRLGAFSDPAPEVTPDRVANDSTDAWLTGLDPELVSSAAMTAAFEEARRTYLEQIMAVRGQRETIEESLALYPDNPALHELWLHAYETELLLIDAAGRTLTTIQIG